jgi:dipeptidyl-peptidase 4
MRGLSDHFEQRSQFMNRGRLQRLVQNATTRATTMTSNLIRGSRFPILFLTIAVCTLWLLADRAHAQVTAEDYARAESFLPANTQGLTRNFTVNVHWNGERFWYRRDTTEGNAFVLVDARRGTSAPAFDHQRLAESLSNALGAPVPPHNLPVTSISLEEPRAVTLNARRASWSCELERYECREVKTEAGPAGSVLSPDGRWHAFVRDYNLYLRAVETGEEHQITTDGEQHNAYAVPTEANLGHVTMQRLGIVLNADVLWSPDSQRLLMQRIDERGVEEAYLIQSTPPGDVRPKLFRYRYPLAGDALLPVAELFIVDVQSKAVTPLEVEPVRAAPSSIIQEGRIWWDEDGEEIYYVQHERDFKTIHFRMVDAGTGRTRTLLTERDTSYIDLNAFRFNRPNVRVLGGGAEILWFSERDGWGQLYLYDAASGELRRRVTDGEFLVRDILHIDEEARLVYFTANGVDPEQDPYFRHLYRASLDRPELTRLTPEAADHWIQFSPDGAFFVDTYTWGGHVPTTVLRDMDGKLIRTLEEADLSGLEKRGWQWPERFRVKARDGQTDIYGVLYRPTNFDPTKSYPVVDFIYPGPQFHNAPVSWPSALSLGRLLQPVQSMAELGFVVMILDGMGTPFRSRAFREVSYGNMGDAGGLADHVAALEQLGERYPYLDLDRVGIFGHSGGGYAAARAILKYPEIFKVAFSSSGNHDQRGYIPVMGESSQGYPVGENYDNQANADLAANLAGHLMLVHGELDENVHPAHTMQLVDALIRANKHFDMLIVPNMSHAWAGHTDYLTRLRWDYFVRHLHGQEPPRSQNSP